MPNLVDSLLKCTAVATLLCLTACGGGGGDTTTTPPPVNHAPTANAGEVQTVFRSAHVALDGTASSDVDGDRLTYVWTQTGGPAVALDDATSAKPGFSAPTTTGTLTFSLVVSDGKLSSAASTITVTVQNRPPVAAAGSNINIAVGMQYTLNGALSSDPDGDPLTYTWTQTGGTPVLLVPTAAGQVTFTAPATPNVLQFSLVVNDGTVDSAASTVLVTALPPPASNAGVDQTVPKRSLVVLHGQGYGPGTVPLTYKWTQSGGAPVTLQNDSTSSPSFTAPASVGDLQFTLVVAAGADVSDPTSVTIHVANFAPTLSAIAITPANPRRADPLGVSGSIVDPDQDTMTVTYVWKRNGTAVAGATGATYPAGHQAKNDVISVVITATDGQLTATATASTTIVDTPAALSSNAPTTSAYGQALTFQVTATDDDGDPTGSVELAYGPAGFAVNSAGVASWTPSGPLFDQKTTMHWGVRLHDSPAVTLTGDIVVTDSNRKYPIARSNVGIPVGNNGIDVQDFDGNGSKEILVGTYRTVYMLAKSGSDYIQTWEYPFDPAGFSSITAVTSGDVDGDGHREIFFSSGPIVVKLDGVTRREVARFGTWSDTEPNGPYCRGLKYADIDNDGVGELVCLGTDASSNTVLYVLDARTMTVKWSTSAPNMGTSLAIGNVDNDPALEIVTNGGYVFDGATHQNEWAYGPGFGSIVDVGDVNGDGIGKIVGVNSWVAVIVYSATLKSPIWQITTGSNGGGTSAIKVADLDGVGPAEILVGDAQWGNVTVYRYDSSSGSANTVTSINSIGDGVSAIGVGDVDGDGHKELIWGSDYVSSGPDSFAIASWTPTATLKWTGPTGAQLDGNYRCGKLAHIAAGQNRVMFSIPRSNSGYGGTRVIAMDPVTGNISLSSEVDSDWSNNPGCDVGNVLGNGLDSVLLGTANLYTNYFTAFDFASDAKVWTSPSGGGQPMAITHAKINSDSINDLVGITNGGVYAWDVAHQTLIWNSTAIQGGLDVEAADLDGDGKPEIIALAQDRVIVYAVSGSTGNYIEHASYPIAGSDLLVADTDGSGEPKIYVLSIGTGIYELSGSLQLLNSYSLPNALSFFLEDSAFGRKNLIVSAGGTYGVPTSGSTLEAIDPHTGAIVWQAPAVHGTVSPNSLSFSDVYGDGKLHMVFGTAEAMYITQ